MLLLLDMLNFIFFIELTCVLLVGWLTPKKRLMNYEGSLNNRGKEVIKKGKIMNDESASRICIRNVGFLRSY